MSFLRRWQAKHLLLAWGVYWIALLFVALHSALGLVVRALGGPQGKGSIGADVTNGIFTLRVESDAARWTGSTSLTTMALWFAGPPLLLWLLWLVTRRAPAGARQPERVN